MDLFQDAYKKWSSSNRDCTCVSHKIMKIGKYRNKFLIEEVPDSLVCEREKLWREYVIVRDAYERQGLLPFVRDKYWHISRIENNPYS